eukprot:SAG11_NODE_5488_length_1547_cov_2.321823_3_plen_64_part_01
MTESGKAVLTAVEEAREGAAMMAADARDKASQLDERYAIRAAAAEAARKTKEAATVPPPPLFLK